MTTPLIQAEIDLSAIDNNIKQIRGLTGPDVKILAAVKANAYGHGALEVSRQVLDSGAAMLGVARIEEGIQLRRQGIDAPILILGNTPAGICRRSYGLPPDRRRFQPGGRRTLRGRCPSAGETDHHPHQNRHRNGPQRLSCPTVSGRPPQRLTPVHWPISRPSAASPGLQWKAFFPILRWPMPPTRPRPTASLPVFSDLLAKIEKAGITIPIRHIANSAATIDMPQTHLDMVRPGIAVYGLQPSDEVCLDRIDLKPAMAVKAQVAHLKTVGKDFNVSYGSTWTAPAPTRIAVVPVGYADGFNRRLSSNGEMLVHGRRAPIVGRVCMDLTMIDVGHIADVAPGDEVVIFGRQGSEHLTADEIAAPACHHQL